MAGMDALAIAKWSAKIQEVHDSKLRYAALCNRNYEGDVKANGSVKIFMPGEVDVNSYTRGSTTIAYGRATPGQQEMHITQRDYFALQYDDLEGLLAFAKGAIWEATIERGTYKLGKTVDTYVGGTIMANGVPTANVLGARTVGTGLAASAYELLVDMARIIEDNDMDPATAGVVVPPAFHSLLKKDDRFASFNTADAVANLRGRPVGQVENLMVLVTTNCVLSGSTYTLIAAAKEACTYAEQLSDLEDLPRDKDDFENRMRSQLVFDAKVIQPKGMVSCAVQISA